MRLKTLVRDILALAPIVLAAACATGRATRNSLVSDEPCEFRVVNRTSTALAIRQFRGYSTIEIGAVNPNESVSESTSCAEGHVVVAGIPISPQIGVYAGRPVYGSAPLVPGERVQLSLYWP